MNNLQSEEGMLSLLQWKATVAGLKHHALLLSGKFCEAQRIVFSVFSPQYDTSPSQSSLIKLATAYNIFFSRRISSCSSLDTATILNRKMPTQFFISESGCFEQAIDQSMMLYLIAGKEKFSQQARLQKQTITFSSTFLLKGGHCPYFDYSTGMAGRQEVSTFKRSPVFDMIFSVILEAPPKETQKTQSILHMASSPIDSASSLVRYSSIFLQIEDAWRRVVMASKQCILRIFCMIAATLMMSSPLKVKQSSSFSKELMISATELIEMLVFQQPQIEEVNPPKISKIELIFSSNSASLNRERTNLSQLKLCCRKIGHRSIDIPFQISKRSTTGQANIYSTSLKHFSIGMEPFALGLQAIILMSTSCARYLMMLLGCCYFQKQCMSPTSKIAMKQGLHKLSPEYFERDLRKLQRAYSQYWPLCSSLLKAWMAASVSYSSWDGWRELDSSLSLMVFMYCLTQFLLISLTNFCLRTRSICDIWVINQGQAAYHSQMILRSF